MLNLKKSLTQQYLPIHYNKVRRYFELHQTELGNAAPYDEESRAELNQYFASMRDPDPAQIFWSIRSMAKSIAPVARELERRAPLRLLDAGCGLGSHAILFSHLGAEVEGVDLRPERLRVAEHRQGFFVGKGFLRQPAKFYFANIFSHLQRYRDVLDIVWVNQAISHIDPADRFLDLAYQAMRSRGIIVISDSNLWNPVNLKVRWDERQKHGRQTSKYDPDSGENVSYAVERFFSIPGMAAILKEAGFRVEETIFHSLMPWFLRKRLGPKLAQVDGILTHLPVISYMCGSYTIVGRKA
jgi:SAM-dependent methyltransferase